MILYWNSYACFHKWICELHWHLSVSRIRRKQRQLNSQTWREPGGIVGNWRISCLSCLKDNLIGPWSNLYKKLINLRCDFLTLSFYFIFILYVFTCGSIKFLYASHWLEWYAFCYILFVVWSFVNYMVKSCLISWVGGTWTIVPPVAPLRPHTILWLFKANNDHWIWGNGEGWLNWLCLYIYIYIYVLFYFFSLDIQVTNMACVV